MEGRNINVKGAFEREMDRNGMQRNGRDGNEWHTRGARLSFYPLEILQPMVREEGNVGNNQVHAI